MTQYGNFPLYSHKIKTVSHSMTEMRADTEEEGKCVNLEYNIQNTLTISHDTSMNFNRNRVVQL